MTDLVDLTQHVQHIKPHVQHVHHAAPIVKQGISMLTAAISSIVSLGIGGGLGWYFRGRGVSGVEQDLKNAKAELARIQTAANAPAA